ncbi:MAG: class I SAM-dependent methyltransferase [Anaerolineales bacterium]|nr:class I SAM-dependent methyltransferase [Anaerolineales bacterium]
MLKVGSKTRLYLGLSGIFISIIISYLLISHLSENWALVVATALASCWVIYFMNRWRFEPPSYAQQLKDIIAILNLQPLRQDVFLPFTKWAMEPSDLLNLVEYIQQNNSQAIVECGSGLSSLIVATALRQKNSGHLFSIEEDLNWYNLMCNLIKTHQLSDWITVVYAPLEAYKQKGINTEWYSSQMLKPIFDTFDRLDVVIVDGPIRSNKTSRSPALFAFAPLIDHSTLVILDDANRQEEQQVITTWKEMFDITIEDHSSSQRGQAYIRQQKINCVP